MTKTLRHDGPMPLLDLSYEPSFRRPRGNPEAAFRAAVMGVQAAGWRGVALPAASVLGITVIPIVEFTGADARISSGAGPERSLTTLALWESFAAGRTTNSAPPAPLRIVGFVSAAQRWDRALAYVQALAGLGAGLVVRQRRPSTLQLMDADADDVWVVAQTDGEPELCVRGRSGRLASAHRVPATRLIEEGLFAHALACGAFGDERTDVAHWRRRT